MKVLHATRADALDRAIELLANHQGYDRTPHADEYGASFDTDEVLDVWLPSWREGLPPAGMGHRSRQLAASLSVASPGSYCNIRRNCHPMR